MFKVSSSFGHSYFYRSEARLKHLHAAMGRLADLHPILSFAPARAFSNSSFGLQNQLTIECDLPPYLIRVLMSVEALSPREHEVLQLMARGLKNKEIAAELIIGERTVKFHVSSILGKLGAGNRTEAVTMALQQGLIEQ